MALFGRVRALLIAVACSGCGQSSDGDDAASSHGGTTGTVGGSSSDGGAGAAPSDGGSSAAGASGVGGSGTAVDPGSGTVTDLWRDFCIATFTEDYTVKDIFGDTLFEVTAGDEYLLLDYPTPYRSAQAAYLTSTGPLDFDIEPDAGSTSFPFTSNCAPDPPQSYFAAFADVTLYAEPELVTALCQLEAGDALPRDETSSAGYALAGLGNGSSVYEIHLNAFSEQCGGAQSGYVGVQPIHVLGADRTLVPFDVIPAEN